MFSTTGGTQRQSLEICKERYKTTLRRSKLTQLLRSFTTTEETAYLDLCDSQEALNDFNVASNLYGSPAARSINSLHNQGIALLATGRLSQALEIYRSASGIGNGHEGIYQNLWTLNRIVVLVQGLDYSLRAVPDGDTERIALRFSLPKGYEPVGRELDRLLLFGRAGNSGNTGGPGLVGGQGFDGKPFMRVYCDTDEQ